MQTLAGPGVKSRQHQYAAIQAQGALGQCK